MSRTHPELRTPPSLPDGGLRVTALGGLGEIGRNMTVFEHAGKLLIVDIGVLFPEEHQPGIDVILPDFTAIRDRLDDVVAIVLTHGHEDHIGGVPYLLRERADIPVIGSELTLAFITAKLKEHRIRPRTVHVEAGDRHQTGPFQLELVAVNHSIPGGLAVAIRTRAGLVLHTDRKSTRLNSSHANISYAVFCLKKKKYNYTFFLHPFILISITHPIRILLYPSFFRLVLSRYTYPVFDLNSHIILDLLLSHFISL